MASTRETYTPDAELVKVLAGTGETLFQSVCRHADLVKSRKFFQLLFVCHYSGSSPGVSTIR